MELPALNNRESNSREPSDEPMFRTSSSTRNPHGNQGQPNEGEEDVHLKDYFINCFKSVKSALTNSVFLIGMFMSFILAISVVCMVFGSNGDCPKETFLPKWLAWSGLTLLMNMVIQMVVVQWYYTVETNADEEEPVQTKAIIGKVVAVIGAVFHVVWLIYGSIITYKHSFASDVCKNSKTYYFAAAYITLWWAINFVFVIGFSINWMKMRKFRKPKKSTPAVPEDPEAPRPHVVMEEVPRVVVNQV